MTETRHQALQYASQNKQRFLAELNELLAIPSISTDDKHQCDMRRAAEWLESQLRNLGIKNVQIMPTSKHPIVYGEWLEVVGAPTMLIYGHYDVQPVDPLDLWQSPPFTPMQRGENLYARGASDMKGQVMATLKALESIVNNSRLTVNIKFLIEGEEEIGSPSLDTFIPEHKDLLSCDFALNPDAGMIGPDLPTITYALRGLAYFELWIYGPAHDLHSGTYGGVVHNPAQALSELIAGMHNEQGTITLPGFFDKVRKISPKEHSELALLPMNQDYYLEQTGAPALWGEPGYLPVERVGARPTLEVNGLLSGFTGEGTKTVLPAWAMAKISTRLVPDQEPEDAYRSLLHYLDKRAPKDIRFELKMLQSSSPAIAKIDTMEIRALSRACETVWGKRPLFSRAGGSIPIVALIQKELGAESVLTGFGLPDDNLHAPNEKLHLPTWYKGIDTLINYLCNLEF
jgi:acetylornithine deacetylase/succinyl-diaminopimelate desuccinylase-like protein